jgi:hypothetical protein
MTTRDDLVSRLRYAHANSQQRILGSNIFEEAACALEANDAEIARLRELIDDAADLIKMQQEWQPYGEQLERDADAAMAAEIQEQRKKNAALRDRISDLERQLAEERERCAAKADAGQIHMRELSRSLPNGEAKQCAQICAKAASEIAAAIRGGAK